MEPQWEEVAAELQLPPEQDLDLLRQAFCHGSYVREHDLGAHESNQRLEFLGDAVLDLVLAEQLYLDCPELTEGELTKIKAALVRAEGLYEVARQLSLGRYLLLGHGEIESGGAEKPSILADCVESVIAAIYLSCGVETTRDFIERNFAGMESRIKSGELTFDHKTDLQELVQAHGGHPPVYKTVETIGPAHRPTFMVDVLLNGHVAGSGSGPSKQYAEQNAAGHALKKRDEWLEDRAE